MNVKLTDFSPANVEFEKLGTNALAYVRLVESDDINSRFALSEELPSGLKLWGLFAADGQPISLSDERSELLDDAEDRDLITVGLH